MESVDPALEADLKARGIIPKNATPMRASGEVSHVSLDDEYAPSPERETRFIQRLYDLEAMERQAIIDDANVRF